MADADTPATLIDQYKLAVEMADRVSARRATANSFFLTVQTALVTATGVVQHERWALAATGLIVAAAWWLTLRSYRMLNSAKFKVITTMEDSLPAAPFQDEWALLDHKNGPLRARPGCIHRPQHRPPDRNDLSRRPRSRPRGSGGRRSA